MLRLRKHPNLGQGPKLRKHVIWLQAMHGFLEASLAASGKMTNWHPTQHGGVVGDSPHESSYCGSYMQCPVPRLLPSHVMSICPSGGGL